MTGGKELSPDEEAALERLDDLREVAWPIEDDGYLLSLDAQSVIDKVKAQRQQEREATMAMLKDHIRSKKVEQT
jgi:hypothetical protein